MVLASGDGKKALTTSEARQAVSISAIALDPRGVSTDVTASFTGNTVTTTGGPDNPDLTTLFKAGMKVIVSGDTDKENRGKDENGNDKLPYTINSVSANSIVFEETISGTDASDLALKLDQYVNIFAIQIQLREDIDVEGLSLIGYADTSLVASTTERYAAYANSIETDLRADGVAESEITSVLAAVSQGLADGHVAQYSDFSAIITSNLTLKTGEEIFQSAIDAFVGSMKTAVLADGTLTKFAPGDADYEANIATELQKADTALVSAFCNSVAIFAS